MDETSPKTGAKRMKVETDVLAVLSAARTEGNALTLTGQLDRKLYERTNKVLDAAGGKWNKKAKAHLFDGDAADAMEQIILTGQVDYAKSPKSVAQTYGFFPSPKPVVDRLIELADVQPEHLVLEPSAGHGSIATAVAAAGARVLCVELLESNYERLPTPKVMGDFLALEPDRYGPFDRIVMNPPFAKQADIHHVTHAAKFLKPGGRLVAVMSAGVRFRENRLTNDFRELMAELDGQIEDVLDGAFRESGTMVNTVIVTLQA